MFDNLEQFASYWLKNRPFLPPFDGCSRPSRDIMGIVLYRKDEYQVQLFIFSPNIKINAHKHKNVDSYEHYMSGDVFFFKNGKELLPRKDFYALPDGTGAPFLNRDKPCYTRVTENDWHGAEIGGGG